MPIKGLSEPEQSQTIASVEGYRSIMMRDGRLWDTDEEGFLKNDADLKKIQPEFMEVIEGIKAFYQEHLSKSIHSIYLTGSVPRGVAIPGTSDLDAFVVLKKNAVIPVVLPNFESKRYPEVSDVQMEIWNWDDLFAYPRELVTEYRAILKLNSACLFGDDLSKVILPIKADIALANTEVVQIRDDFSDMFAAIEQDSSTSCVQFWCKRIMKNIIRAGFYMVIPTAKIFTRDLNLCVEHVLQYYPSLSGIQACLEYLKRPIMQATELCNFVRDGFGSILLAETEKWLDAHNPTRQPSLRRTS